MPRTVSAPGLHAIFCMLVCLASAGCEQETSSEEDVGAPDGQAGALDGDVTDADPGPDTGPAPDMAPGPDAAPGGCRTDDDCDGPRRCIDGACIACFGDEDCVDGYICETGECVEGCRGDETCPDGTHCAEGQCIEGCADASHCPPGNPCIDGSCVDCAAFDPCLGELPPGCEPDVMPMCGCVEDDECPAGEICVEAECVEGCRDDGACGAGQICEDTRCVEGCRGDDGCPDGICDDGMCLAYGIGCRVDDDCAAGDRCEADRCVPAEPECEPDRLEPNDAIDGFTPLMFGQVYDRVSICPGDRDLYGSLVPAGDIVRARLQFGDPAPVLEVRLLDSEGALVAEGAPGNAAVFLEHAVEADGVYLVEVRGADPETRSPYALEVTLEAPPMCMDTRLFPDADGDGFGVEAGAENQCVEPEEATPGFARAAGDCREADPWANPDSSEICGDWVDDDCDGVDVACPESQPAVQVPDWDCQGPAPANVYGWARFADGEGYFVDGGCFVFFEGMPGEFYVQRRLDRANQDAACDLRNGCVCPSLGGWPSYDRRLYAFTLAGDDPDACEQIGIIDHGGERQPVSNDCRKYLYQMHFYDIPYSLVAPTRAEFERRIALFPTVEVACAADLPHRNLPYQSLLTAPIELNPAYAPLP